MKRLLFIIFFTTLFGRPVFAADIIVGKIGCLYLVQDFSGCNSSPCFGRQIVNKTVEVDLTQSDCTGMHCDGPLYTTNERIEFPAANSAVVIKSPGEIVFTIEQNALFAATTMSPVIDEIVTSQLFLSDQRDSKYFHDLYCWTNQPSLAESFSTKTISVAGKKKAQLPVLENGKIKLLAQ